MEWIDDVLVDQRIIVKDIKEDLFDGQVLQKLLEKLGDVKLQVKYFIICNDFTIGQSRNIQKEV